MTGRRHRVSLRFRTIWETAITLGGIVALTISVDVLELRICKWTGVSSGIFRMGPCCTYERANLCCFNSSGGWKHGIAA